MRKILSNNILISQGDIMILKMSRWGMGQNRLGTTEFSIIHHRYIVVCSCHYVTKILLIQSKWVSTVDKAHVKIYTNSYQRDLYK